MKSINHTSRAVVTGLMLAMTLGWGLMTPRAGMAAGGSEARAQQPYGGFRWDRRRLARFAYTMGYNRGYEDAANPSYRTYRDIQRWREGNEGFEDPMGNRAIFRDNFRRGFMQGFRDARFGRPRRYTDADLQRMRSDFHR